VRQRVWTRFLLQESAAAGFRESLFFRNDSVELTFDRGGWLIRRRNVNKVTEASVKLAADESIGTPNQHRRRHRRICLKCKSYSWYQAKRPGVAVCQDGRGRDSSKCDAIADLSSPREMSEAQGANQHPQRCEMLGHYYCARLLCQRYQPMVPSAPARTLAGGGASPDYLCTVVRFCAVRS
jgi:hypothetical protein